MYMLLLKTAAAGDFEECALVRVRGASLPQQVAEDFRHKFGIGITEGYGLSEASPVVAVNPQHRTKYLSIGQPIPGVKVKIVDLQGAELPSGIAG